MKTIIVSPKNRTAYNFRGELIRTIIAKGHEAIVTGPDRTDVDKIEALGARFVEIPIDKNGVDPRADLRYCKALTDLFRKEKPDRVLSYTAKAVIYGSVAAKRARVPWVVGMVTGLGYAYTANTRKAKILRVIMSALYRWGFRKADWVLFQNEDDREEFLQRKLLPEAKTGIVNGSGVDMTRFEPAPLPEKLVFFMLSRILKSKGVREYLEAARIAKQKHPEAAFYLLGKYETTMQDAIPEDEVEPYIRDGIVERFEETSDVRPYYAKCSVYVLPSYREGTPRTVLEAMAMGRPVITTDAPGCRATTKDGETGFLVPVRNSAAVAEKMCWFCDHPEQIPMMGQAALAYCHEKYDVQKVNETMLQALKLD